MDITLRSLFVSSTATVISTLWSLPLAFAAVENRRLRIVIPVMESLSGIPTVLIGLLLYILLSRSGPLGFLNLLYTPTAIIIGESILVTPLIVATAFRSLKPVYESIGELAESLGATRIQAMLLVFRESWSGIAASVVMAFSRALGELGVAWMVGGNIRWQTRVFATAIALQVAMGEFEEAMWLGAILLVIEVPLIVAVRVLQGLEK